jgi:hypothetical protein
MPAPGAVILLAMRWPSLFLLVLPFACDVRGESVPSVRDVPFACQSDADCEIGHCVGELGICSRNDGQLTTLLFEVTPQASDAVYGGARFLKVQNIGPAAADGAWFSLNVPPRVPVSGRVLAAPDQTACVSPATPASSTLPVTLTFTPREQLLGLAVPSYELSTTFDARPGVREYTFEGSLPPGRYDVYMRPNVAALGENCRAIPQIFRDRVIGVSSDGLGQPLELEQPPPASLRLTIPWRENLEGWQLDMVHPVTGEIISNRVRLRAEDVNPDNGILITTLNYSRADPDFILASRAEELVRLTPPAGLKAGTVLLQRSGLELLTPGEGVIGNVSTFGSPVQFQSWVWKEDEPDSSVPGTVNFSALDLDEVAEGVLASFEDSATVDDKGQVRLSLLPGRYRIRVTPPGLEIEDLGLMAGFESSVTVWPNPSMGTAMQSGHVIEVPAAVTLRGQVVAQFGDRPIHGVEVRATASNPNGDACLQTGSGAAECELSGGAVLQRALAQDPFVPRTRSGLSQSDGQFELDGLDCGQCQPGAGARFDLSVRPQPETGLPWLVRPSLNLYSSQLMGPIEVPMPVVRPMRLTYGEAATDAQQTARALPGALVRVFALIDDQSQVVSDATDLVPCVSLPNASGTRCLQSLLQIAEVRSGSEGELLLLLPPSLE